MASLCRQRSGKFRPATSAANFVVPESSRTVIGPVGESVATTRFALTPPGYGLGSEIAGGEPLGNTLGSHRPMSERTTPLARHEGRVGFVPQRGLGREVRPISEEEDAEIRTPRRIVCVTSGHHSHRHIANAHQHLVSVGIGGTAAAPGEILTVEQIRDAIAAGESFYTYSASTQRVAFVHSATCQVRGCNVETIRSNGDAVADNNLDNLAPCP